MYTRCPTCSTCFRVTERHLAIAKGKVRCGQCKLVFNAPEHAIDDLPVNPLTANKSHQPITPKQPPTPPPAKIERKKVEPAVMAATAKDKLEQNFEPIKIEKEEKPAVEKPTFDADATMIADMNAVNKEDLDMVNLDIPHKDTSIEGPSDVNDVFSNDVDLDAAIDQLTKATEDAIKEEDDFEAEEEPIAEITNEYSTPENNNADVFITDAYDATNASSVADILNEMEGQLSLDISEPEQSNQNKEAEYDANNEFDFIQLDDEKSETNEDTLKKHFDLDEFGINEEIDHSLENTEDRTIDVDKLFDQVDLSDFHDSEINDEIILDNSNANYDNADVPFQLRNDIDRLKAPSQRRTHPLIVFSFFIILLVLSFSQAAYFRSHELVKLIPASRPILVQFCEQVGCHYSGPRDLKKIQLISRDVRLHPKEKKALLISAAMINNAPFAQPYPNIHIRLSDISGNVIAERIFNAKTYMGKLSHPFLLMKSKTPVHINFEVVDPGKDAINFEFTFL